MSQQSGAATPRDKILKSLDDESLLENKSVIPTGDLEATIRLARQFVDDMPDGHHKEHAQEQLWKANLYVEEVGKDGA